MKQPVFRLFVLECQICFSFQVDAINLLNGRDIDHRIRQLLAHAKEIDLASSFPVRLRLGLGH